LTSNIKAIFWDLGGVLVRTEDWSPRQAWEQRLGLSDLRLTQLVFQGEAGRKAELGEGAGKEVWEWVGSQLNLEEADRHKLENDFWSGDQLDTELIELIRSLKDSYKLGLISNAWLDLRDWLDSTWEIADAFHDLVISAEVGMAKPDRRIYQLALTRLGVEAHHSVFVDDVLTNVHGASQAGMFAIQFTDRKTTVAKLEHLLNLS
jgi:epoxide hydrolase-like predicted phosphatase